MLLLLFRGQDICAARFESRLLRQERAAATDDDDDDD